jgi:hypothetical protein
MWKMDKVYCTGKTKNRYTGGVQIFRKSRSHLKILATRTVTSTKLHYEDPEICIKRHPRKFCQGARNLYTPNMLNFNCKSPREEAVNTDIRNGLGPMSFFTIWEGSRPQNVVGGSECKSEIL